MEFALDFVAILGGMLIDAAPVLVLLLVLMTSLSILVGRSRQPVQRETGHDRVAGEGGGEGRAGGDHHQGGDPLDMVQRELDQLQRRGIDPVRVLDHHQHRVVACECEKPLD